MQIANGYRLGYNVYVFPYNIKHVDILIEEMEDNISYNSHEQAKHTQWLPYILR